MSKDPIHRSLFEAEVTSVSMNTCGPNRWQIIQKQYGENPFRHRDQTHFAITGAHRPVPICWQERGSSLSAPWGLYIFLEWAKYAMFIVKHNCGLIVFYRSTVRFFKMSITIVLYSWVEGLTLGAFFLPWFIVLWLDKLPGALQLGGKGPDPLMRFLPLFNYD